MKLLSSLNVVVAMLGLRVNFQSISRSTVQFMSRPGHSHHRTFLSCDTSAQRKCVVQLTPHKSVHFEAIESLISGPLPSLVIISLIIHRVKSTNINLIQLSSAMGRKKRSDLEEEGQKNATASPKPTSNVGRPAKQPRTVGPQRKKRLSDESEPKVNPRNSKRAGKPGRPASKTKKSKVTESMEAVKEVVEEEVESKEDVDEVSPEVQKEELAREKLFAEIQEE